MIKIFVLAAITIVISAMFGFIIEDKFKFKLNGFVTPVGFAALMCVLQLFYYPAQLFNLPSLYVHIVSFGVYGILIVLSLKNYRRIWGEFVNKKMIWVMLAFTLFLFTFYQLSLTLEFSDGQMYLGYISSNIDTSQLNNFNLWTGEIGKEWDSIYLFQGYYPFVSFLCYAINSLFIWFGVGGFVENIVTSVWTPAIIYSIISSMVLYNIVDYFDWKNKISHYSVLIISMFLLNFYYYRVAFAYYGNTFRTLYVSVLFYFIYRMIKEKKDSFIWLIVIVIGAGIAFSSSFLFVSFTVMYCLLCYFVLSKEEDLIRKMSIMVLPILIYTIAKFSKDGSMLAYVLLVAGALYYLTMNLNVMKKIYSKIEHFFYNYGFRIFVIAIPLIGVAYSAWLFFDNPTYPYNFFHYFQNHKGYDMVKDYFFIYSDVIDNILNVVRWIGVGFLFFKKSDNKGLNFLKWTYIICFITFLNPLSTSFISDLIASNVYYRSFEVIFNPFTECLLIYLIFNEGIQSNKLSTGFSIILIVTTLGYHAMSYMNVGDSGYGFYLAEGKFVEPIYKMSPEDYEVVTTFRDFVKEDYDQEKQMVVISHADGLRSMVPAAHQLFTARQYWYDWDRVNQAFYQMSRRHYSWQEPMMIDYSDACKYINEFKVDYLLIKHYENWEYDNATNECTSTIYEFSEYKIKKVK